MKVRYSYLAQQFGNCEDLWEELKAFVDAAHDRNLLAALAGSLETKDLLRVHRLGADIVGVRGAVCARKDRVSGKLEEDG